MNIISIDDFLTKDGIAIPVLYPYDLQVHSFFSDGKESPTDLLEQASKKGIQLLSITDHNSVKAYTRDFFEFAEQLNINLIQGVEIDCYGGLDILVYAHSSEYSKEYQSTLEQLTNRLNSERNEHVKKYIEKIKNLLNQAENVPWLLWKDKDESEKKKILSDITFENIQRVDMNTGKISSEIRDYVSKPHVATFLHQFNLINTALIATQFSVPEKDAEKFAYGYITKKLLPWPIDELKPNIDLLKELTKFSFVVILAHPGKTFHDLYPNETDEKFPQFISEMLSSGVSGVEGYYRHYKQKDEKYNEMTRNIVKGYIKEKKREIYITGGSDTHGKIE